MVNTKYYFKCIGNPKASLFKPQYLFDVEAMRQHPEYVECDENGVEITKPVTDVDLLRRMPINMAPPAQAKTNKKKGK